ncbi:MAG: hypothetical protein Q8P71_00725 [bacterium]|nr:hypothetical protein [bacterium]
MRVASVTVVLLMAPAVALAHCPLCTVGAAAVGGIALALGVSSLVIGVFLGAAFFSMGWWFGNLASLRYGKRLFLPILIGTFLLSVIPLIPLFPEVAPLYISMWGEYGSLLHQTYVINLFVVGSLVGSGVVFVAPFVSSFITKRAQRQMVPYQGVIVTMVLLVITSLILFLFV